MIGYRKSVQFAYNPNNELKQTIAIIDTGLQIQRTTTSYFYDAFGRRIAKTSKIEQLNKLNQRGELVKYPTALLHLRKTDKTEHSTTLMLWEGNRQIQEYTDDFVFTTVYDDESFIPVARVVQVRNPIESDNTQETFKVYHYHNNHLGTPQELTDDCGEVIWANYEWAWGGRYTHFYKEQSLNGCAILECELQPIKFQGQFFDTETSLHYNRFRYYDSDVGMFIGRDPIGLLGGVNVFAYAPNPIHWVDPWGLNPCTKGDKKRFQTANSITGRWVKILSNKTPEEVRDYLTKKGWKEVHPQAGTDKVQHTVFIRTTKSGKTYGLDYNPANKGNSTHGVPYWKVKIIGKNDGVANGRAIGRIGSQGFEKYDKIKDSPVYINGNLVNFPK